MPTAAEWRRLLPWLGIALAALAAGAALIWYSQQTLIKSRPQLVAAQAERAQNREKLSRIAEEEREVREKAAVYRQLTTLGIMGQERRLEWADTIARIRTSRELLDLRYRVEPRKPLGSIPGKPANVEFYSSLMIIELAMLHEGDLFRLLADLRESGNAYYSIRNCAISRVAQQPSATSGIVPRLSAQCSIELITIVDPGAKT